MAIGPNQVPPGYHLAADGHTLIKTGVPTSYDRGLDTMFNAAAHVFPTGKKPPPKPNIRGIQRFLLSRGYKIAVDGKLGPQTREAIADWHTGPKHRTLLKAYKATPAPVQKAHVTAAAHVKAKAGASRLGRQPGPARQDVSGGIGVSPTGKLIGAGTADAIAGAQFDPQINDLGVSMRRQPVQAAQDLNDIGSWYDQVKGSLRTAGARDAAASAAGRSSISDAVAKIVGSLGGSANAGSSLVGAAGADAVGTLGAMGTAQDQYNADLAPLLAAEAAGARSRTVANQNDIAQQLRTQLLDLQGQRGQAKTKASMDILSANNATRQQDFQNALAIQNAQLAAQSLGLDATKTMAAIASDRTANALRAKEMAAKTAKAKGGWESLDPVARENYVNQAVQHGIQLHSAPDGSFDPDAAANTARAVLRTYGFDSARSLGYKGRVPNRVAQGHILSAIRNAIALKQVKTT